MTHHDERPRFSVGCSAIVTDEHGRVLLSHRTDHDLWNLPGGGLEPDEAPWEAAVREVREETTLEAVVERLSGVYYKPDQGEIIFQFICRVVGGGAQPTEEADDHRFFAPDDLPANVSPRQVERIHDALAGHQESVLRVQRGPGARELIDGRGL